MSTPEAPHTQDPSDPAHTATPAATSAAAPAPAPSPRAGARSVKNMVWALLICAVAIVPIALVVIRPHKAAVPTVDWQPILAQARSSAPYHLLGPDPMPAGWKATSARYSPPGAAGTTTTWHLGVLTGDQLYVGLEQSNGDASAFRSQQLGAVDADGNVTVDGVVWQRFVLTDRSDDERALVRTTGGVTTIVEGTPAYDVLTAYVRALR